MQKMPAKNYLCRLFTIQDSSDGAVGIRETGPGFQFR